VVLENQRYTASRSGSLHSVPDFGRKGANKTEVWKN
jgi:hypothetical protein